MKVPKREVLKFVIKSVLHSKSVDSQQELLESVKRELRKVDGQYSVTGKRLREIALSMPDVEMDVSVRKGWLPKKCPSCGSKLKKTWDRNLRGRKVLRDLRCPRCRYKGTTGKWAPSKYAFRIGRRR